MILNLIESVGDKTIKKIISLYKLQVFSFICLLHILQPSSYNATMKISLVKNIFHTSIRSLPIFSVLALVLGSFIIGVVISMATKFNLQTQIGSIIISFVVNEFSPLFTVFFIAIHSKILFDIKLDNENMRDEEYIVNNIVLPRVISGVLSTISLSIILSLLMLVSGYVFTYFFMGMDLHTYKQLLFDALNLGNVILLFFKSITFGLALTLIPIYNSLKIQNTSFVKKSSPFSVLVKLFFAIFFIELASLLFVSLIS